VEVLEQLPSLPPPCLNTAQVLILYGEGEDRRFDTAIAKLLWSLVRLTTIVQLVHPSCKLIILFDRYVVILNALKPTTRRDSIVIPVSLLGLGTYSVSNI